MTSRCEGPADGGCRGDRPLRRDAERNRQRILQAAAEVFTQRGLDATLDDVARQAGVGVGTVYRRFPDKETLVAELFQDRIDELVEVAEQALAAPDPWLALVSYLEYVAASLAGDLGLRQLMMFATYGRDRVAYAREQMRPVVGKLIERAQEAGALRPDFTATDVPLIAFMLSWASEYASPVQPDLWRRYLAVIIDGMRPARDGVSELPVAALGPEEVEVCMRAHGQRSTARR
jgi:AcrR family transcriptional regulator